MPRREIAADEKLLKGQTCSWKARADISSEYPYMIRLTEMCETPIVGNDGGIFVSLIQPFTNREGENPNAVRSKYSPALIQSAIRIDML